MDDDDFVQFVLHLSAAGFTQRATIDPDLNEIYVFSVS